MFRTIRSNDMFIMMPATFALVFTIVLAITRALIGAIIVLITVVLSFCGAFGLSVFVWESLLGAQLHWPTLPIAFIVLEIGAGVKTGLIRTTGSSGGVVFTAGFVFAFTTLIPPASDVKTPPKPAPQSAWAPALPNSS